MTAAAPDAPTLIRPGKGAVLVLDEATMTALGIGQDTPIAMKVVGRQLIVEAAQDAGRADAFQKALNETASENSDLFRRLAK